MVGVDTREVDPLEGVVLLRLDFTDPDAPERIAEALGGPADAVLSDAAPRLSGVKDVDRAAFEEIHEAVLAVAERVLGPGGALVVKALPGPETDRVRKLVRARFGQLAEVRPEGTRGTSREFYWIVGGGEVRRKRRSRRGSRA